MAIGKTQQKDHAKTLFINEKLSQKEIATRVTVTEKTIGKWIQVGGWDKLRRSMITVKDENLSTLYKILEAKTKKIEENNYELTSSKDTDDLIKLTSAIKKLEVSTSLGEIIDVAKKIGEFVRPIDLEFAQKMTYYFDTYIQTII